MMSIETIENPNSKIHTVSLPIPEYMADFSKVVISRPSTSGLLGRPKYHITNEAPMVAEIFRRSKWISRCDMIIDKSELHVSGLRRMGDWSQAAKDEFEAILNEQSSPLIAPLELKKTFTEITSYQPDDDVKTAIKDTFDQEVRKAIDLHGGSLEILNIEVYDDDEVEVQVLLMGSCADCASATTQTLEGAKNAITARIDILKEEFNNLDSLKFGGIEVVPVTKGFWMPRQDF